MSTTDDAPAKVGLSDGLGPLVVSPCLACPTPGRCTDVDRCVTPKAGEKWHILRAGATACTTVTIAEITQRTMLFEPTIYGVDGERLPLRQGLHFVERVSGPNVQFSGVPAEHSSNHPAGGTSAGTKC